MSNVLIVFYSRGGVTETLANAIAEGAAGEGAEVRVRRAREFVSAEVMALAPGWKEGADAMNAKYEAPTTSDIEWADAVIFGTPTRFGTISSELKAFMDTLGGLWFSGKLYGKVGSAFTSTNTTHGGNEGTILHLFAPMSHFGWVIVPPGYGDPATFVTSTPYGASAVVNQATPTVGEGNLSAAKYQGKRVAQVTNALVAAK